MAGYLGAGVNPTGNQIAISVGRPKSKKKVKKKPVVQMPAYDPLAPLTPQQLLAMANQQASAAINPALQALERAGRTQSENIGSFTAAIAEALGNVTPTLTNAYEGAADTNTAFGNAFGDTLKSLGSTTSGDFLGAIAGVANTALGAEGGVQAWLQGKQPKYAVDQGGFLTGMLNSKMADQRQGILDQRISLQQQALDALNKRELDKIATKASIRGLKLDEKKFKEDQRQADLAQQRWQKEFDETVKRNDQAVRRAAAEGRQVDAAASQLVGKLVDQYGDDVLDKNGRPIPVLVDTTGAGKDKAAAQAKKAEAIDDATSSIFDRLDSEFSETYNRVSGRQPVRTQQKEVRAETRTATRKNKKGEDVQFTEYLIDGEWVHTPLGDPPPGAVTTVTEYWTGSGWSTDPNDALMEPAGFEEKVTIGPGEYAKVRRRVIGMLRQKLRRYVKDPRRYSQLADEILSAWYTIPTGSSAAQTKNDAQRIKNTIGW